MALTHQGGVLSICATAQSPTLNQAAFEALTFVEVPGVVTAPSFRIEQNTLTQNTLGDDIAQIQGGFRTGQTTDNTIAFREITDPGIAAMEAAASSANLYALKYELNNSGGSNGTTYYALCFVAGGGGPEGGGGEDFANRVYSLTPSHQAPIEVAAA